MIKEKTHIFQGMKRDNHQIRQEDKFLWNAHNIRLTNRDDSTLLSITNERGTLDSKISFEGDYVGHCILNKYLIIFTATIDDKDKTTRDIIYRVEDDDGLLISKILYEDTDGTLNLSPKNPIEAIGYHENDLIQKVYWVDGRNQPRVINIAKPELRIPSKYIDNIKNFSGIGGFSENEEANTYMGDNYPEGLYTASSFDFIRELALEENISVWRNEGSGIFSPGTIQYAFSYYNRYEQESNIFYVTPLMYISPKDRGGNPEETVSNVFNIQIENIDKFEYIRVYSIHRTSIDAVPTVKVVSDVPTNYKVDNTITITDNGTLGYTIDPTQLLYIGGKSIIANTIEQKDNTLFFGNITLQNNKDFSEYLNKEDNHRFKKKVLGSIQDPVINGIFYNYENPLYKGMSAGFKYDEYYRCGVQVQTKDGNWSEPIYLDDIKLCTEHPMSGNIVSKFVEFSSVDGLIDAGIKRIRACVVFPRTFERSVICQGILNPTVYNVYSRSNSSTYAQSSWFFRPATKPNPINEDVPHGSQIEFRHNKPLYSNDKRGSEVQSMVYSGDINVSKIKPSEYKQYYFVDENIVTFNSPDLEFDPQLQNINWSDTELRIIGTVQLGAIYGDIDIQANPSYAVPSNSNTVGLGFHHSIIGYKTGVNDTITGVNNTINGGLVSGLFYRTGLIKKDTYDVDNSAYFMVYPWHKSGSIGNDVNRSDGSAKSAVLSKKIISNLKFFNTCKPFLGGTIASGNEFIENKLMTQFNYKITTPKLFNSSELSLLKIHPNYLNSSIYYLGNIDTLVTPSGEYDMYINGISFENIDQTNKISESTYKDTCITKTSDPIRMKYKSSPHLVFSLKGTDNEVRLLPVNSRLQDTIQDPAEEDKPGWIEDPGNPEVKYDGVISHINCGTLLIDIPEISCNGKYSIDYPTSDKESDYVCIGYPITIGNTKTWKTKGFGGIVLEINNDTRLGDNNLSFNWNGVLGDSTLPTNQPIPGDYIGDKSKYYKVLWSGTIDSNGRELYTLESYDPTSATSEVSTTNTTDSNKYKIIRDYFTNNTETPSPYLLLAEIVKNIPEGSRFGGKSESALSQNLWVPAGRPVTLKQGEEVVRVPYEYGDTWYSRYDCIKTYPYTPEDENQIVEIGSFMCETRVNIDGRYDKDRGNLSNLYTTPNNFNLINNIYSQSDNFFNYRILNKDYYKQSSFNNQITWSKEKHAGEEIDTWANVTLANTLDMDGSNGKVTSIKSWNDMLMCFQEKAVNQLMFNSRVQIPTSDGVPIEISNGYKVDGSRVFSNTIGCTNKWSISVTPLGIYFIDSNTNDIYLFNGSINKLGSTNGMSWWIKDNNPSHIWSPTISGSNGIRTFYDSKYDDIYFTPGPMYDQPDALCYSNKLQQFTSLMSYGGTQAMFNFSDRFFSLKNTSNGISLYKNNAGDYNYFYGEYKGWDFSFIENDNPLYTKIFDTIELRADVLDKSNTSLNIKPLSFIKVSNEYQDAQGVFDNKSFRKKFRIWRGLIPRNNNTRQRIRNPWTMITLGNNSNNKDKVVVHDVSVKYTV